MKKFVLAVLIGAVLCSSVMAAGTARTYPTKFAQRVDTNGFYLRTQIGGVWDSILTIADTLIPGLVSDSMYLVLRVTGTVNLSPGGKLYVGWSRHDSVAVTQAVDSVAHTAGKTTFDTTVVACPKWAKGPMDIPFHVTSYKLVSADSTSTGLSTASYFLNMTTGGSSNIERALVKGVRAVIYQERR